MKIEYFAATTAITVDIRYVMVTCALISFVYGMVAVAGMLKASKTKPVDDSLNDIEEAIDLLGSSYFVGYDEDGVEVVHHLQED